MALSIVKAIEEEKNAIRDGINEFGLDTREKMIQWGERLRLLQPKIRGEFEDFLETLPISKRTAYNWITASKQLAEGKKADKISNLFTYETNDSSATFADGDSVLTRTYEKSDDENDNFVYDDDDENMEDECEDDWEPINSPMSVEAKVINNDKTPRDRFNQDIPVVLEPIFGEVAQQYKLWKKQLSVIKQEMNKRSGEFGYESLEARYIKTRFDNLYELIRLAEPYSVCIVCQGDGGTGSNCKTCNSKGWITEPIYNAIPAEFKIGLQTK